MSMKLNVLLGRVEHLKSSWMEALKDYIHFFTKNEKSFRGIKKTYAPRPDTIDLPNERESINVITTVDEKLHWLQEGQRAYIDGLFSVEATNASGTAKARLITEDGDFGELSSCELMRLIGILETKELRDMYGNLPVRSDAENWIPTTNEQYKTEVGGFRKIYELPQQSGIKKTTDRGTFILKDPNFDQSKDMSRYTPVTSVKETILEVGDWTLQRFTGEMSQRERAELHRRYTRLLVAAKEALKTANEAPVIESVLTADRIFNYLHGK